MHGRTAAPATAVYAVCMGGGGHARCIARCVWPGGSYTLHYITHITLHYILVLCPRLGNNQYRCVDVVFLLLSWLLHALVRPLAGERVL